MLLWSLTYTPTHPPLFLAVSKLPVVRSEHVRTLFDSTQSQEYKSYIGLRNGTRQCALGLTFGPTLYLWFLWSDLETEPELVIADSWLVLYLT